MYINPKRLAAVILVILLGVSIWLVPGWLKQLRGGAAASPTPTPTPSGAVTGSGSDSGSATASASPAANPTSVAAWTTALFNRTFAGQVPPTPTLTAIRSGSHSPDGYDRVSFDFQQESPPGYSIRYVDKVTRDASGQTVTMPGSAYLQLVFTPAAAHNDQGKSTVANPPTQPLTLNYQELWSYVMNGDNEGNVSVALGLAAKSGYRVGELRAGDHLWTVYVDVRIQ